MYPASSQENRVSGQIEVAAGEVVRSSTASERVARGAIPFTIQPRSVAFFFAAIVATLTLAHIAGVISKFYFGHPTVYRLVPLFDMDVEHNIPSLFNALLLILCSGLLSLIAAVRRRQGERYFYWALLAAIFLFMSIDEAVEIHEYLARPVRSALHTSGVLKSAGLIPYVALLLMGTPFFVRFLLALPARFRYLFAIAGVVYITGAIGFECLGWFFENAMYALLVACEESLEMSGLVIFIYALLSYVETEFAYLYFRISSAAETQLPSAAGMPR